MLSLRMSLAGCLTASIIALVPVTLAAEDAPAAERPGEFTGRLTCSSYWLPGKMTDVLIGPLEEGNLVRRESRGYLGRLTVDEMTDERLTGEYTHFIDRDEYFTAETEPPEYLMLSSGALRVAGDGGDWLGHDQAFYLPGTYDAKLEPRWEQLVLHGSGDYAGLIALVEMRLTDTDCYCWSGDHGQPAWCQWELRGVVLEGQMPPVPSVDD